MEPFEHDWPAVPANVGAARNAVLDHLEEAGLDPEVREDVRLALSEAVTNAVVHAFVGTDPGRIRVRADEADDGVRIVVEDDGRGMQPRTDSPGMGLGMPLIANVSLRFDVHTAPGQGTQLCMWFARRDGDE